MAQLSLPYRIAIIGMLAVLALWFTVLKPKDPAVEAPLPVAPGVTGLANGADAATGAATDSATSAAASESAANGVDATGGAAAPAGTATAGANAAPATGKAPAKAGAGTVAVAAGDRSAPLLRALDRDRAVVLLFWNRRGTDDQEVRRAVAAADRRDGNVVVKVAPVRDVGRYQSITRGVQVLASPTVLVIGPDKTAKPIVGLTTTGELDQAVGDTLAAHRRK